MRIAFHYRDKNQTHCEARDFVRRYIRERGLLAVIEERPGEQTEPYLVVDGFVYPLQLDPRSEHAETLPAAALSGGTARETAPSPSPISRQLWSLDRLASILEEQLWCL